MAFVREFTRTKRSVDNLFQNYVTIPRNGSTVPNNNRGAYVLIDRREQFGVTTIQILLYYAFSLIVLIRRYNVAQSFFTPENSTRSNRKHNILISF